MKARILFHGTAVLVLVAAVVAAAQTPSTPKKPTDAAPKSQTAGRESSAPSVSEREASSGMASGKRQYSPVSISHESSAPSVSAREAQSGMASGRKSGSVIVLDREAQSGMMTGRRQHEPVLSAADKSLGSAHAVESVTAPEPTADGKGGNTQNASSNPMYKDNTKSGSNPLYEGKDKQAAPKPAANHETVEYKDGEDMTTRYRPGNNKTTNVKPTGATTTSSH